MVITHINMEVKMAYEEIDFGSMFYKIVYDKILKASSTGYTQQNCNISFEYEVNYEYLSLLKYCKKSTSKT